jgi:hypothetical protein
MKAKRQRPCILITLGGGGYGRECRVIMDGLVAHADLIFARPRSCQRPGQGGIPNGSEVVIPDLEAMRTGSKWTSLASGVAIFFRALAFLRRHQPDCAVGVTTRESVFVLAAARLLGIETVFIESVTRVTVPSQTLRLISGLRLAKHIWVQWPELANSVPNAKCLGRVL